MSTVSTTEKSEPRRQARKFIGPVYKGVTHAKTSKIKLDETSLSKIVMAVGFPSLVVFCQWLAARVESLNKATTIGGKINKYHGTKMHARAVALLKLCQNLFGVAHPDWFVVAGGSNESEADIASGDAELGLDENSTADDITAALLADNE